MANRFLHKGVRIPDAVGNADGFAVNEYGALGHRKLVAGAQVSCPVVAATALVVTTNTTLVPEQSGTIVGFAAASNGTSMTVTLPSATKGPMFFQFVLGGVQSSAKLINPGGEAMTGMIAVTAGSTLTSGTTNTLAGHYAICISDGATWKNIVGGPSWAAA